MIRQEWILHNPTIRDITSLKIVLSHDWEQLQGLIQVQDRLLRDKALRAIVSRESEAIQMTGASVQEAAVADSTAAHPIQVQGQPDQAAVSEDNLKKTYILKWLKIL